MELEVPQIAKEDLAKQLLEFLDKLKTDIRKEILEATKPSFNVTDLPDGKRKLTVFDTDKILLEVEI